MKFKHALILLGLLAVSACGGGSETNDNTAATAEAPPASQTLKDLSYADVSAAEKLDLYVPAGTGPFPMVVYVHGGGFRRGDKGQPFNNGIVERLLSEGYAVASLNYRLSGEAIFPAAVNDEKAAVRYLRAHAQDYRLDRTKFAAWGDSAGGNLVSILGTSCGVSELEGADLGNSDQSSCVQAVVDWYGPNDFLQIDQEFNDAGTGCSANHDQEHSPESDYIGAAIQIDPAAVEKANPITYISAEDPPFFIQHGTADCSVPPQQSQLLHDALAPAIGAEKVSLNYMDGWVHGDPQFTTPANLDKVLAFLNQQFK